MPPLLFQQPLAAKGVVVIGGVATFVVVGNFETPYSLLSKVDKFGTETYTIGKLGHTYGNYLVDPSKNSDRWNKRYNKILKKGTSEKKSSLL